MGTFNDRAGLLQSYRTNGDQNKFNIEYDPQENMIGVEILKVITEEVFGSLTEFKNQDPLLITCELEVIGLFGYKEDMR